MAAFCPLCGTATIKREVEGRLLDACPACGHVQWRNPLVATCLVIDTPAGVVLGRRSIEPGYGLWCLPGGFVNEDEHPELAARRECREEIGADVAELELLRLYHVVRGDGKGMVVVAYRAQLADGQAPSAGEEMLEVASFPLGALPELAFSSHRQALEDYTALRSGRRRHRQRSAPPERLRPAQEGDEREEQPDPG